MFFAILGKHNQVIEVIENLTDISSDKIVRLDSLDMSLIGKEYYNFEFVDYVAPRLARVALINEQNVCYMDAQQTVRRIEKPFIEVLQQDASILGFTYNEKSNLFQQPQGKPLLTLSNNAVSALDMNGDDQAVKVGSIWWLPVDLEFTITAISALPESQLMVMIEKVVRDQNGVYVPVDDVRVKAMIDESGNIIMKGRFRESGNYRITAERLNMGLNEIGVPFNLDFEQIEFDAYETA